MKQPEDNKTIELSLDGKRGRGRPAKPDALTPAQRAKRYRDNARAQGKAARMVDTTKAIIRDDVTNNVLAELLMLKEELKKRDALVETLNNALTETRRQLASEKDRCAMLAERLHES